MCAAGSPSFLENNALNECVWAAGSPSLLETNGLTDISKGEYENV